MRFISLPLLTKLLASGLLLIALAPSLAQAITREQPLARFIAGQDPVVRLAGTDARLEIPIPLPDRWQARELTLNLVYRNSVSLLREHSQLRVELHGLVIAQFPLDPNRPEGRATIRLPLDLLKSGYNPLRFSVAQHTVIGQCEDPTAPELWTQIDARQSTLRLEYERRPVTTRLSRLDDIFDQRHWGEARLHIPMIVAQPDNNQLRWGALVAQAAALRFEYVPLQVNFGPLIEADSSSPVAPDRFPVWKNATDFATSDLALIGTRDQLAPLLGTAWASGVTDGYLAILPRNDDPTLALLVVSGRDEAEVSRAATTLSLINIPFPDASSVLISNLDIAPAPPDSGPRRLPAGTSARLEQLGVATTTLLSPLQPARMATSTGLLTLQSMLQPLAIEFWAPAGLYIGGDAEATLSLHFSYGASLRRDSVLNVRVNGVFARGIALDNPQGASFINYEVRFPLNLLRAGRNRIELIAMMAPAETDFCALRQGENLLLTVYDDSSLRLPSASQFTRLPDLRLFSRSGFPFLHDPQGGELAVQVIGNAPETIAAAWTLLGRLVQITSIPLHKALIGFNVDTSNRELIAVGPVGALDPKLAQAAPLVLTDPAQARYVLLHTITDPQPVGSGLEHWLDSLEGLFKPRDGQLQAITARATFRGPVLDHNGALTTFESPTQPGRSVLLLTAKEPTLLLERAVQLAQPDYWYNLQGGLALWDERKDSLRWQAAETSYTVGQGTASNRFSYYFEHYPWALLGTVVGLFTGLALLLLWMLRRFRRRHHPEITHEN